MRVEFRDIEVTRRTLAKILVGVFMFNLVVMGVGAWYSTQNVPPIPNSIEGPNGEPAVTESQVQQGKAIFQSEGMMNHGSILGNGAYFGVDFTADTLDLKIQFMRRYYARQRYNTEYENLASPEQAAVNQIVESGLDSSPSKNSRSTRRPRSTPTNKYDRCTLSVITRELATAAFPRG